MRRKTTLPELRGACAFIAAFEAGAPPPGNPYDKGSHSAKLWRAGFCWQARAALPADLSAIAHAKADVSRGTFDERVPEARDKVRPGRGHGKRGPRSEWSETEKTVAWCARMALTPREISGLMPRRNPQAVSNQLGRMKACQGSGIRDQGSEGAAA